MATPASRQRSYTPEAIFVNSPLPRWLRSVSVSRDCTPTTRCPPICISTGKVA